MKRRDGALAWLSGLVLVLAGATAVAGYQGQTPYTITVRGGCDVGTATATVVDMNGNPVAGQVVKWTLEGVGSASDKIGAESTTNASGVATTPVTLAPVSGNRTVVATAGSISGSAVVYSLCGQVLPITSTAPERPAPAVPPLMLLVVLAFSIAGAVSAIRMRPTR
jgi:Bacterial Ig-like domain (group 1)